MKSDEMSQEALLKDLEYAASVLEAVYLDETR